MPYLNDLFLDLNSRNSNLKFTLELGLNSIHFLDLTIFFVERNDEFHTKFNVYRKPTFTGLTIPGDSFHPVSQKLAA